MASVYKRGGKNNRHGRYRITYTDELGRRVDVSAGTGDKDTAQQIADKLEADAALKRRGVITPHESKLAELNAKPVADHVADYIGDCRRQKQDTTHVDNKEAQLKRVLESTKARVLSELTREAVQRHLNALVDGGLSARTHNQHKTTISTFVGWCYANVGVYSNPLAKMKRMDESADQRLVRRAMTDEELARLLAVKEAVETGRADCYTVVTLAGLRVGDAIGITWGDVDLEGSMLRIRRGVGKSRREDHIPLHPQALAVLRRIKPPFAGTTDKVFKTVPRVKTFHKDCQRAGIEQFDAEGTQLDRHALGRTTLGTRLAMSGVLPTMAAKLMRHADVKTTMKHYTKLRLHDASRAMATVPQIVAAESAALAATGTDSASVTLQWNRQHTGGISGPEVSPSCSTVKNLSQANPQLPTCVSSGKTRGFGTTGQAATPADLTIAASLANVPKTRAIGAAG